MSPTAPPTFSVRFETSRGDFQMEIHRDWAPQGADRFHELVSGGFFDDQRFFRVIDGFVVQFGIHGDPQVAAAWRRQRITDDPVHGSNTRGTVTFATAGPNSRTTQLFINYGDNSRLDSMGFSPIGAVTSGMEVVDQLYSGYGDGAPRGRGPDQGRIQSEGNPYLDREFPELDRIHKASLVG
jgi:peptidyl-prolyl cis-trans isomerase A (cyclophilin A)